VFHEGTTHYIDYGIDFADMRPQRDHCRCSIGRYHDDRGYRCCGWLDWEDLLGSPLRLPKIVGRTRPGQTALGTRLGPRLLALACHTLGPAIRTDLLILRSVPQSIRSTSLASRSAKAMAASRRVTASPGRCSADISPVELRATTTLERTLSQGISDAEADLADLALVT